MTHSSFTPASDAFAALKPAENQAARQLELHRIYRHFKGDHYLTEDIVYDAETGQELVLYRKLYGDGSLWVRPKDMFLSEVDHAKYPEITQKYRFELLDVPGIAH